MTEQMPDDAVRDALSGTALDWWYMTTKGSSGLRGGIRYLCRALTAALKRAEDAEAERDEAKAGTEKWRQHYRELQTERDALKAIGGEESDGA